ncbi:hypothetical protein ACFOW4_13470 [Micromonospora sp. GCM10011542]|uniref:hypothetical protein n=1 Tax=Micromonospora sp. GCM10011542 TaxID=3317337 RepID=UPI00361D9E70
MSFEDWRRTYPQDFDRACDALIVANRIESGTSPVRPPTGTSANLWTILISAVVGAFLTMLGGEWKSRRDRQVQAAQALRSAAAAYAREGNAMVRALAAPMAEADDSTYYAARDGLASKLHEAAALRGSVLGTTLLEEILSIKATAVVARWPDDAAARRARQQEAARWLTAVEIDAMRVAAAVQRPWPWYGPQSTARAMQLGA